MEVVPGDRACLAACAEIGERYLMSQAPRLPLNACTASDTCSCKYRKWPDRRREERRGAAAWEAQRLYAGTEQRLGRGRRAADLQAR